MIECRSVSFAYEKKTPILLDVQVVIERGEFIGIFGPNGGGKTTLLKLLMGFLTPTSGWIQIMGKKPFYAREEIAYVPQTLQFDRKFPISVYEVVLCGRQSHLPWYGRYSPKDKEIAQKALDFVGLDGYANSAFGTLSGGQAQRTLIARALASEPKILLLDEPTASIDQQAESEIFSLLNDLKKTTTILMVTHHLKTATSCVDRMLCVQREVFPLKPDQVCDHFSFGLYHPFFKKNG